MFLDLLKKYQNRIDVFLPIVSSEYLLESLKEPIFYSLLAPAKRLRPALVYLGHELFKNTPLPNSVVDKVAASVELIHCYSLIHDDLPAMDNDVLRRNLPTNHIKFNENTAILAGDIMQALAFKILTDIKELNAEIKLNLINLLSQAAIEMGIGQHMDMTENKPKDIKVLKKMHAKKTGFLINNSFLMGFVLANYENNLADFNNVYPKIKQFGENIGLLFQVQDDILDKTSTSHSLGKTVNKDQNLDKMTYVSLLGLQGACDYRQILVTDSIKIIDGIESLDEKTREILISLATFISTRDK